MKIFARPGRFRHRHRVAVGLFGDDRAGDGFRELLDLRPPTIGFERRDDVQPFAAGRFDKTGQRQLFEKVRAT